MNLEQTIHSLSRATVDGYPPGLNSIVQQSNLINNDNFRQQNSRDLSNSITLYQSGPRSVVNVSEPPDLRSTFTNSQHALETSSGKYFPSRLDCEMDMQIDVQSALWWNMDNQVKIKEIYAMKSDLILLDENGGLHQWSWRKQTPYLENKIMTLWGFHSHSRLNELGITDEKIVKIDASPLKACFSTNLNNVYTFMDRCIPFRSDLNHKVPLPDFSNLNSTIHDNINIKDITIDNISVCNSYSIILLNNGTAYFWGLKTMPMLIPLQSMYLNERKRKEKNKAENFTPGSKVYNNKCALHKEGSVVIDCSYDKVRFGRITNDVTDYTQNITVEIVKNYKDPGYYHSKSQKQKSTKKTTCEKRGNVSLSNSNTNESLYTNESWQSKNVMYLDDILDNVHRYEIGVIVKDLKPNIIVCTDPELIDKPFSEIAKKATLNSLSVWKLSDTYNFNEKNSDDISNYVKYKLPSEALKINSAVTNHKILAISATHYSILSIVQKNNGDVTGAVFNFNGKNFKEIEFKLPLSIKQGITNNNFKITKMKHFGDLVVLTTDDGGETVFKGTESKSKMLEVPAFPSIKAIRTYVHYRSNSKFNDFRLCLMLPKLKSILNENDALKYSPYRLMQHEFFYQRQNILHVLAYEALYYGYKHDGIKIDEELKIAKYCYKFIRTKKNQMEIIKYLSMCDMNGLTPVVYAVSIRSYHVAHVYIKFICELLNCQKSNDDKNLKESLYKSLFPQNNSSNYNSSIFYMLCANDMCTFTTSGPRHIKQDIYQCYTCSLSGKLCCCAQCASICHYGHNCLLKRTSPTAYCDCWEASHCKCLISGDQEMRVKLFKYLIDNIELFSNYCNERWDILVSFLLYTDSRSLLNTKANVSYNFNDDLEQLSNNVNDRSSNVSSLEERRLQDTQRLNLRLFSLNLSYRPDPLSIESLSTADIDRITQRGLVHGNKLSSFTSKFNFILTALEIIFSNVYLIKKIITPRELKDDCYKNNLYNDYSQQVNFKSIEDEIGVSNQQWDVRYIDSIVCYLIFKCKREPLNKLLESLKKEQIIYRETNKEKFELLNEKNCDIKNQKFFMNLEMQKSPDIVKIFIRSVCRVYNVFIGGMSPILFKNSKMQNYFDIFNDIFNVNPTIAILTLVKFANAVITPVLMNVSSFQHGILLSNNEEDCIDKTVKMFVLHPRINSNNLNNNLNFQYRGGQNLVANNSTDSDDENDYYNRTNSFDESSSYFRDDSITSDHDSNSSNSGSRGETYLLNRNYDTYSSETDRDDDDRSFTDSEDVSDNSQESNLYEDDLDDEQDSFDLENVDLDNLNNSNSALTVIFDRQSVNNDSENIPVLNNLNNHSITPIVISNRNVVNDNEDQNGIERSNLENNTRDLENNINDLDNRNTNRLVASLNWAISNSNNNNRSPTFSLRDTFGRNRHGFGAEAQPRLITTLFQDNNNQIPYSLNRSNNRSNSSAVSSLLLSSNEASARNFAAILRAITKIMTKNNMFNLTEYYNLVQYIKISFNSVTTWLFRTMDYTEAMLRHGVATDYRLPKLIKNEMTFPVQNYQQLNDTNSNLDVFTRNTAISFPENDQNDLQDVYNMRVSYLSGILSLIRSCDSENLYMMPKVDVGSMRYVAYIFDALVYFMKREKLNTVNEEFEAKINEKILKTRRPKFFKRTDSTLMLASLVPNEIETPLRDAIPLAHHPSLLVPTSTKKDLFGFTKSDSNAHNLPFSSFNPYSTNLYQYNDEDITMNLFVCDLVDIYTRWNCCVTLFAKLFLKDVGAEPGSALLEIGHYDTKVRSFKRQLSIDNNKTYKEYHLKGMSRDPEVLLFSSFEKLNNIFKIVKRNVNGSKIPKIVATFLNEPGEGQGVTRNFLNDIFLAMISVKKLPDLKNVFCNLNSCLDFSGLDIEVFLDCCELQHLTSNKDIRFDINSSSYDCSQELEKRDDDLNQDFNDRKKQFGKMILNYLNKKSVVAANKITGIILAMDDDLILKCVICEHSLFSYVKDIQQQLHIPYDNRITKQSFYENEEYKFNDYNELFFEPGIKGHYFPKFGKGSRERANAFINVGRLIGQCIILDVVCPLVLSRPVVKFLLGKNLSWHDFAFYDGDMYESLRQMIIDAFQYQDMNEHLCELYFACEKFEDGKLIIYDLIENGRDIPVTPSNIYLYVEKYCLFYMRECVKLELEVNYD